MAGPAADPPSLAPSAPLQTLIRIAAAVVLDESGRTLLVRKRGTAPFMQPGGKVEEGETALAALEREIDEELGCGIDPLSFRPLGRFTAPAANEPGWTVEAELFSASLTGEIRLACEIDEFLWLDPDREPAIELAPLTRNHAMPLARQLKRTAGKAGR